MFKYFIHRPLIVNLFTIIIVLVGFLSLFNLQKQTFPPVVFDMITVVTPYPGSSAEDVEKLVTLLIERELKAVTGIKEMNAMSAEGSSIFSIKVDPDYNIDKVLDDIKTAVYNVDDLPEDAEVPKVTKLDNTSQPSIRITLTDASYDNLRDVSKALRDELEGIKEVSRVDLAGYRKDEILLKVDPLKLNQLEITFDDIVRAISQTNINLTAGKIETSNGDITIRTNSEYRSNRDIENVVLRSNTSGKNVLIKDVAIVTRGPEEESILERSNGKRAIILDVGIKQRADVVKTTNRIKKRTESFLNKAAFKSTKIAYRFVDDMSYYVSRRLEILKNSGMQGIVLVFICLLFFLNFSTSVVTSLGAPLAFLISFIVMDLFGISINLISMFGLIMVLGMLVDDSIIVSEHFYALLERGESPKNAAYLAVKRTCLPIIGTVITTILAFGSLFFMGGIMGKFLWHIPAVIIICLGASLIECFFILPSHLSDFVKLKKGKEGRIHWYDRLASYYKKILLPCLKHPFVTSLFFFVLLISSIIVARGMRFELFPGDDVRIVFLQIKGKVGDSLEKTDAVIYQIEKMVLNEVQKEEFEQVRVKVGIMQGLHANSKRGNHYASLVLYLTPPDERERSTDKILSIISNKAQALAQGYTVVTSKVQGGPPKGAPVEIDLVGDSLDELKIAAKKVSDELRLIEGVLNPEIDFEEGKSQFIVDIDQREVKRLGLTVSAVALELRRALAKDSITEIRESDEDISIRVLIDRPWIKQLSTLDLLYIPNSMGQRIPLSKIAKFVKRPGAFIIRRKDRKRIISVSASINNEVTSPLNVVKKFRPKMDEIIGAFKNLRYNFAGENDDTKESMDGLKKASMISFLAIFFVLVFMFGSLGQPLVIMSAIPMGLIGVIIAFKIKGATLGFMSFLGVVALIGVVVNDSIVLVSFINEKLEGINKSITDSLIKKVIHAASDRFRAVILTTFTTVAGLLPIAHAGLFGGSSGDPFVKPMAFSFAYGLLFGSLITLFYIPANYLIYLKMYNFIQKIKDKKNALNLG